MTTTARTANEVASLFFAQKLVEEKERVGRWVETVQTSEAEGKEVYCTLFLHETCNLGMIRTIISRRQGTWLYKMIQQDRRYHRKTPHAVTYEGVEIGTWSFSEGVTGDPYDRLTFTVDPQFMQNYLQTDPQILRLVAEQIKE